MSDESPAVSAAFILDEILCDNTEPAILVARAQAYATLALAEAVEQLRPAPEPDDEDLVPFEQTKAGWKW